ncbi:MAG: YDG domain-containing protein [Methylomagnum sp.]
MIGAGLTVRGHGTLSYWTQGQAILNLGTLDADAANRTLTVNPATFTNNGLVSTNTGTLTISAPSFANNGTLQSVTGLLSVNVSPTIVNIDATKYGFAFPTDPAPVPGQVISPITNPTGGALNRLTLPAGTYTVSNGTGRSGANGSYTAWRIDGGANWVWNFVVADDATHQVVVYGEAGSTQSTQAAVAAQPAVQNFATTFTLPTATTLDFMVRDYGLTDNAGGVALNISTGAAGTSFATNAGVIDIGTAGTVKFNNANLLNASTGTIRGSGTLNLGADSYKLTNFGTLSPGASPGHLNIVGGVVLESGSVTNAELNGRLRGAGYDSITASGAITINGGSTLNLSSANRFAPVAGDAFHLLEAGATLSGSFSTINSGFGTPFNTQYDGKNLAIQADTNAPVLIWGANANGQWETASNWNQLPGESGKRVPQAGDIVLIDRPAGAYTVTVGSGAQAATRLVTAENLTLASGGTLTLTDASTIGASATLSIAGGTLVADGAVQVDGGFALSGGTLAGSGRATLYGPGTWTGGSFTGNLELSGAQPLQVIGNQSFTGRLSGSGLVNAAGAILTNNGVISPGASGGATTVGSLAILGDYQQGSLGTLEINVEAFGTDTIAVSGIATLAGSLNVSGAGNVGNYTVLTGGNVNGTFDAVNSGPFVLTPIYGPTSVALDITGSTSIFWDGGAGTFLWTDAANWSTDSLPVSASYVTIDPSSPSLVFPLTSPVVLNAGDQAAATLICGADFTLSGGSLTVGDGGATFNGGLILNGGTLSASGNVTANGAVTWSGGTVTGAGTLTTASTTTVNGLYGAATLQDKTWDNNGAITLTGTGRIDLIDTAAPNVAVLNNSAGASLAVNSTATFPVSSTGSNQFNNYGVVNWNSDGGVVWMSVDSSHLGDFNNYGTVKVAGGDLGLQAGGVDRGVYDVAAGRTLTFFGYNGEVRHWQTSLAFTGTGALRIDNSEVMIDSPVTLDATAPALTLSGGGALNSLDAAASLTIHNAFTWTHGILKGPGLLTTTGETYLNGAGLSAVLLEKTWNNSGVILQTGSNSLFLGDNDTAAAPAPELNNLAGGVYTMASTGGSPLYFSHGHFNNAGTLNWNAPGTIYFYSDGGFNNTGRVNASADLTVHADGTDAGGYLVAGGATLKFESATRAWAPGLVFGGSGALQVSGSAITASTPLIFGPAAGTLTPTLTLLNSTLDAASPILIGNAFAWTGSTIKGAGTLTTTGLTTVDGGATLQDKVWNNSGTVSLTGTGYLYFQHAVDPTPPTFNNLADGVVLMESTATNPIDGSGTRIFDNAGRLDWNATNADQGHSWLSATTLNNSGTVNVNDNLSLWGADGTDTGVYNVARGKTLSFVNTARTWGAGLAFNSTGTATGQAFLSINGGTVTVNAPLALGADAPALTLADGVVDGVAGLTLNNGFTWTGGLIKGAGTLTTTGATSLSGTGALQLQDKTWNNTGTIAITGSTGVYLFNADADADTDGRTPTLNNQSGGVIDVESTNASPIFGYAPSEFNNAGTLIWGPATLGTSSVYVRTFNNSGLVSLAQNLTLDTADGTDSGAYAIADKTLTFYNSARNWNAGSTFSGSGNLVLTNNSVVTLNTPLAFGTPGNPAVHLTVQENATLDAAADITLGNDFTWNGGTLKGAGLLTTTGASTLGGTVALQDKTWHNGGSITLAGAASLTLHDTEVATPVTAKLVNLAGGVVSLNSSASDAIGSFGVPAFENAGMLTGSGGIWLGSAGTLTNTGVIAPGSAGGVGALSISGNLALGAGGSLNIDLGGTGAGQSDTVTVNGNVTMNGTLNATPIGGYTPVNDDKIAFLLKTGTATGTFATINAPTNFQVGYNLLNGEAARLQYITGPSVRFFDNGNGDFDWGKPANWSGDILPGSTDEAKIDAGFAVTHGYGTDLIRLLTINGGNSLEVSGGSLTVSEQTTVDGALTASHAGQVQLDGPLAGTGTVNVSATLTLNGGATGFAGPFNNGGTVNVNAGTVSLTGGGESHGRFNVAGGALLDFGGGTHNLYGSMENAGTVQVSAGNVGLGGTWNNAGLLSVTGGAFSQGGTLAMGGPGSQFSHTGGAVNVNGLWDAAGHTVDLGAGGDFTLSSGTFKNGILTALGGTPLTSASGNLDGATLGSDLTVNGDLFVHNGLALASGVEVRANSGDWYLKGASWTLGPAAGGSATLSLAGVRLITNQDDLVLTLGAGLTLRGQGELLSWSQNNAVVNQGTVDANVAGQTLSVYPTALTNTGLMRATAGTLSVGGSITNAGILSADGGAVNLYDSLTNTGTVRVDAGTLNQDGGATWTHVGLLSVTGGAFNQYGTLTLSGPGSQFSHTGGTVSLNGLWDAAGHTVALGAGGPVTLSGTFKNGTLTSGGLALLSAFGTLDGATLGSNLSVQGNLNVRGGLTLAPGATVSADASQWWLHGSQTLGTPGTATLSLAGTALIATDAGDATTFGAGLTVQGHGAAYGWNPDNAFVNHGTFLANTAGETLLVNPASLANTGLMRATAGTLSVGGTITNSGTITADGGTVNLYNSLDNTGTVRVDAGVLNQDGGATWTHAGLLSVTGGAFNQYGTLTLSGPGSQFSHTGGAVSLNGLWDAAGHTVDLGAGGPVTLNGTFKNGVLTSADGLALVSASGTLDGATVGGGLVIQGHLSLRNGLTLAPGATVSADASQWYLRGSQTLGTPGAAILALAGTNLIAADAGDAITFGAGLTVQGHGAAYGWNPDNAFVNHGTFLANSPGNTLQVSPASLINNGLLQAVTGALYLEGLASNAGIMDVAGGALIQTNASLINASTGMVRGAGTLNLAGGAGTLTNEGVLAPGGNGTAGTLSILGNLQNTGTIVAEIGGTTAGTQYDVLAVSGNATVGGTLNSPLINGYIPPAGESFDILTATAASGSFATLSLPTGFNGAIVGGNHYRLTNSNIVCAGVCWDGGAGTSFWSDVANWTGDVLPGLSDIVFINLVAGIEVNHASGDDSIKGLNTALLNNLTISGGSLTLNDSATPSTLAGDLTIGGGSFTANGPLSTANLTLSGGTLAGAEAMDVAGDFHWTDGVLTGGGSFATSGASTLDGAATKVFRDKTWNNAGTITLADGSLLLDSVGSSAVLTNTGVFQVNTTNPGVYSLQGSGNAVFNNAGVFDWNSLNPQMGYATSFINAGTVNANQTLQAVFNGENTGTYFIAPGAILDFASGTQNLNSGTSFTGSGLLLLNGAAVNVNIPAASLSAGGPAVKMQGGTVNTAVSLTVNSGFTWTGGTLAGAGSYRFLSGFDYSGGSMNANGAVEILHSGGVLNLPAMPSITSLLARSSGGIQLLGSIAASGGGDAIVLVSGGGFQNTAGASALSAPNGRWLVWSNEPASDNRGGLAYSFKQYDAAYGVPGKDTVLGAGNGFLYSVAPTVTPTLAGTVSKTYSADPDATLAVANYGYTGAIDGDTVVLSNPTSGLYDNKNAGTAKTVTVGGINLLGANDGGAVVYGYGLSSNTASAAIGTIKSATLTAELVQTVSKVYDGTTAAALGANNLSLLGVKGDDDVLVTAAGAGFDTKNVGTDKTVTVTGLSLSGADAGNYALQFATDSSDVGTITPASLTPGLTGTVTKVYDGATAATLDGASLALSGAVTGDAVGLSASAASYDSKHVGTGKAVTATGLSLTGADAGNYVLGSASASGNIGAITPATLTPGLTGTVTKVYDGTATATLGGANLALSGVFGGDAVGVAAAGGGYDTKNVGTGKAVSATGLSLTGADAGNYALGATGISANIGAITPAGLTATLSGTLTKVYDGTTAAALGADNIILSGLIGSDTVTLNGGSGHFDTKNVGTGKTITVTGLILGGVDAGNYVLGSSDASAAIGSITPASLTAELIGTVSKVYDATTAAALGVGNFSLIGVKETDEVLVTAASASFDTKDVGTRKTVTASGLALSGGDAGNYALNAATDSAAIGRITPADLTASLGGTVAKVYDGTAVASLGAGNLVLSGVLGGDMVVANGGSGVYDTKDVGTGKAVTVTGLSLGGVDAGNYTLGSTAASAPVGTITPASLTVAASGALVSKVYDGTTAANLGGADYALSGVIAGDSVGLNGSGNYDNPNAGTGRTVTFSSLNLNGVDAGNYLLGNGSFIAANAQIDFASMIWSGLGGDNQWSNPLNWTPQRLPDSNFDVDLSGLGSAFVTVGPGDLTVHNLSGGANLSLIGGSLSLEGSGSLNNLRVSGGSLTGPGGLSVEGFFQWSGGTLSNTGGVNVTGPVTLTNTVQLDNTLTANNVVNNGSLNLGARGVLHVNGDWTNTGGVGGFGTIELGSGQNALINQGVFSPGASPGVLHIVGNFVQGASGVLKIELNSADPSGFDRLDISGSAQLGGTLNASGPAPVGSYPILSAQGGVSGAFATVNSGGANLAAQYQAQGVTLVSATAPPSPPPEPEDTVIPLNSQAVVTGLHTSAALNASGGTNGGDDDGDDGGSDYTASNQWTGQYFNAGAVEQGGPTVTEPAGVVGGEEGEFGGTEGDGKDGATTGNRKSSRKLQNCR